jgi:glycosyltransferase involved in cell wall biosynthesis
MGKKTKSKKTDSNATVSILTPTACSREKVLTLLAECIKKQTYISKIRQWVIVTADWTSEIDFVRYIEQELKPILPNHVEITHAFANAGNAEKFNWGKTENYGAIGYLRNLTNRMATSDFMVCCDDDDYYVPTRVQHAVEKLENSDKDVAGCSPHVLYDFDFDTTYQFKKFNENHSINSVLAFKKEYLATGAKYDGTKTFAEEHTFLNGFSTPMVQLDPKHCVVQMVHSKNTYNKRKLILNSDLVEKKQKNVWKLVSGSKGYVPKEILEKYRVALTDSRDYEKSEFDIVYYLGNGYKPFKWDAPNLGGSEQAVKHITESWALAGKRVCVYGDFEDTVSTAGVHYKNYLEFKCTKKYNLLILWRRYGACPILKYKLRATRLVLDLHDNLPMQSELDHASIDYFMVKSKFHGQCLYNFNKKDDIVKNIQQKIKIIPNGVRVDEFTPASRDPVEEFDVAEENDVEREDPVVSSERNPYKFIYCSCYKRNLLNILKYLWPALKKLEPRAELAVMYGTEGVTDEHFKEEIYKLLAQSGVTEYGRRSTDFVRYHKITSTYHLYYSKTMAETDCISIRESTCAGCIPLISNHGVFAERNGIKLEGDPHDPADLLKAAKKIAGFLKPEAQKEIEKISKSMIGKEVTWNQIAKAWTNTMDAV